MNFLVPLGACESSPPTALPALTGEALVMVSCAVEAGVLAKTVDMLQRLLKQRAEESVKLQGPDQLLAGARAESNAQLSGPSSATV